MAARIIGHDALMTVTLPEKLLMAPDPAMTRHLGGPETPEMIHERHERYCQSSDTGKDPMFVVILEPEKNATGSIGYWKKEWQGETVWETGWSILPEYQGYGIAIKATVLVVERARREGTYRFMHAFPSIDNAPSNAICRKVGFVFQKKSISNTRQETSCVAMTGAWTFSPIIQIIHLIRDCK
ncbi:MAG: GNAT family N-acetyltransferase [Anaerolineales bacterium]|nr:GNAT family N-acetyltransferase [Anaerolineales bacterium]